MIVLKGFRQELLLALERQTEQGDCAYSMIELVEC